MATTITPIAQTITAIPTAGHRGVDIRDIFVTKQEAFQDALTATTVTELNALKTQINTTTGQINTVAGEVTAAESLVSPYYSDITLVADAIQAGTLPTIINDASVSTGSTWSSSKINTTKQDTLVSGTNIKSVNGQSLLGSGNLTVEDTKGENIASATTINIGTTGLGNLIHITGTTTITSLGTASADGVRRTLVFDGALTLTHNATSLICIGNENINTVVGMIVEVVAETTSNWRVLSVTVPSVSATELSYLDGVTSPIQTRLESIPLKHMILVPMSYTVSAPITGKYRVICVGAGGAGGQANSTSFAAATGGGAGGITIWEGMISVGTNIVCVLGAGGLAPSTINTSGGNGGTSTVTFTSATGSNISLSSTGGRGGTFSTASSPTISGGAGGEGSSKGNTIYGGAGGDISGTSVSVSIKATGGGGCKFYPSASSNGGNISGNSSSTSVHIATGGGGCLKEYHYPSDNSGGYSFNYTSSSSIIFATMGGSTSGGGGGILNTTTSGVQVGKFGIDTSGSFFGSGGSGVIGSGIINTPIGNIGGGGGGMAAISTTNNTYKILSLPFAGSGGLTATSAANAVQTGCEVGYGGGAGGLAIPVATAVTSQVGGGDGVVIIEWE